MSEKELPTRDEAAAPSETLPEDSTVAATRRELLHGAAAAGVTALSIGILGRSARAQSAEPIKIGLLEDQSGNIALFSMPKLHAAQLAIQEINNGFTLASGPTGLGGIGTADGLYREVDDILVPSGDKGVMGRSLTFTAPDTQSDNRKFQELGRRLILDDKVDVIFGADASSEREALRPIIDQTKTLVFLCQPIRGRRRRQVHFLHRCRPRAADHPGHAVHDPQVR